MPHSETADARHGNLFFLQPTGMLEGTRGPVKRVKKIRVLILVTVYESTFVLHYVLQYSFCGNTKLHIGKGFLNQAQFRNRQHSWCVDSARGAALHSKNAVCALPASPKTSQNLPDAAFSPPPHRIHRPPPAAPLTTERPAVAGGR